ncbi:MAG: sensor domain-containing diguanylate cyclase [Nitriliruptoraceae bacterium]|nr:sensor domain-containing diguanylate cyclase [Nitriliruptoraceae bacterium]
MAASRLLTPITDALLDEQALDDFEVASRAVLRFLRAELPMGYWSIARVEGGHQRYLYLDEDAYGVVEGDSHPWESSFCIHMVAGEAPRVAPDVRRVPTYVMAEAALPLSIGAYVGIPVQDADGSLFGTICGLDPGQVDDRYLDAQAWLELVASMLTHVLRGARQRMDLAREADRARVLAMTDDLTGLANRRAWDDLAGAEAARLRTLGDPGIVLIVDLDGLKAVNDRQGHEAGDAYIVRAARALRTGLPTSAIGARLGGDEFAVLVPGMGSDAVDDLLDRLEAGFADVHVQASVGHAALEIATGLRGAMEAADARMYETKRERRAARAAI